MVSQDTWFGTIRELWRDIVEGDRFPRLLRIFLAVILVAGTVWSAFLFRQMIETAQARDVPAPPGGSAATEKEVAQLEETAKGFRNAVLARAGSTQLTVMAATVARRPFSPSEPEIQEDEVVTFAEAPPNIWIRAILIRGNEGAAVADIEGFGDGVILKRGTSFGGGLGRVIGISNDKVVVTWSGQQIDITVDR
jgi:type II secretory pathway component PulC